MIAITRMEPGWIDEKNRVSSENFILSRCRELKKTHIQIRNLKKQIKDLQTRDVNLRKKRLLDFYQWNEWCKEQRCKMIPQKCPVAPIQYPCMLIWTECNYFFIYPDELRVGVWEM